MNFLFGFRNRDIVTEAYASESRALRLSLGLILISFFLFPHTTHANGLIKSPSNLGLVGYWSFNEGTSTTATDYSGNGNSGAVTNFAIPSTVASGWTNGKLGKALVFDGNNDYVVVPDNTKMVGATQVTASAWMYLPSAPTPPVSVVRKDGEFTPFQFRNAGPECSIGTICFIVWTPGLSDSGVSTSFLPIGRWFLITTTWVSGQAPKLYIDGVFTANYSAVLSGSITDSSNPLVFGATESNTEPFTGKLDEIRMYNRALSASEIATLYNTKVQSRKTVSNNGLVGYWPMEEGSGTNIGDYSGNNNTGTTTTTYFADPPTATSGWTNGRFGKTLNFGGATPLIDIEDSASLNFGGITTTTFSAWIYLRSYPIAGNQYISQIIGDEGIGLCHATIWRIGSQGSASYNKRIGINFNDGSDHDDQNGTDLPLNTWTHIAVTTDGTNARYYINGALDTTNAYTIIPRTSTCKWGIGYNRGVGRPFDGKIDDVRLYKRTLSGDEISALYKQNQSAAGKAQTNVVSSGLVGYWPFGGNYMNWATGKALDASGSGNDGLMVGMGTSTSPVQGKVGQAMQFNAVNTYIDAGSPSSFDNLTEFTYSAWVKPRSIGTCTNGTAICGVIMGKMGNGVQGGSKVIGFNDVLQIGGNANSFYAAAVTGTTVTTAANSVDFNEWQHIAWTVSNSGQVSKIYKNGVVIGTTNSVTLQNDDQSNIVIGAQVISGGFDNAFDGYIDEPRVYNRVLTATEIVQLYNAGR